ncbi:hypothetical protein F4860DRAFT_516823 [Xylaria cubensis]|nr:hypothetical protein F4860DRAFT_516823 [Xylaria cubensis]
MANILARFIHRYCWEGCDSYNAIDLNDLPVTNDADAKQILLDTIYAAVQKHIEAVHPPYSSPCRVIECHFVWKDNGPGHNLLRMEAATLFAQIALARARGWVDCLHIKYEFIENDPEDHWN